MKYLPFFWLFAVAAAAETTIHYELPRSARVSILITAPAGDVVRELLHAAPRTAGTHSETWDGRDEAGQPVKPGAYTWKLLATQGLRAEYLLTLGTKPTPSWETWPGNHGGASAVAVAADALYVGGGCGEGTPLLIKQSLDGQRRFWTIPQWLDPWVGITSLAVADGTVYLLQYNAKLYRFDAATGQPRGEAWQLSTNQCTGRLSVRGSQIVVTTRQGIAWLDPATGRVRQEVNLPDVRDVKIDGRDRVLAIAQGAVMVVTASESRVLIPASKLVSPFRLAVDSSGIL